eukprot:TRINITY_DN3143_c1_g2_i1.p1 TRINITY_DN3143_c1_g2~~TRINITY_DN3143_c1_g2_i1.p1  ORF type:complete len:253 (+),score=68.14 TRINITY_DN3143_c1_g2_i1:51-761(+)
MAEENDNSDMTKIQKSSGDNSKRRKNNVARKKRIDPNTYAEVYVSSPFTSKVKRPQRKWAKDVKPEKPKRTQTRPRSPKLGVIDLKKARELDLKRKKKLETEIERKKKQIIREMEKNDSARIISEKRSKPRVSSIPKNTASPFGRSQLQEQEAAIERRRKEKFALERAKIKQRKEYMYMRSIEFETRLASAVQEEIVRQEKEQARLDNDKRLKLSLDYEESVDDSVDAADEFEPIV